MSELPKLSLQLDDAPVAGVMPDRTAYEAPFRWPTPPFAAYAAAERFQAPEGCEIEGLNGSTTSGRLIALQPAKGVAQVQVPPARGALALRFAQFRRLTLTTPLPALLRAGDDPHASILGHRPVVPFQLQWAGRGVLEGRTIGHVEDDTGLFLFPPADERGGVLRMFVPRHAYESVEFGPSLGDALIDFELTSPGELEEAVREQERLRNRKLGDILVDRKIVTPDQLIDAIDQQARMPMVRIGEALLAMGLLTQAQLDDALEQQKSDRSIPLGELLVRLGLVTREDLQSALARKMGYPVVDVTSFPVEVDALRKVPAAAASRLNAMPLLLRNGRLIVAMEDPSRRATIEELEFVSQGKVVPVLATATQIARALAPTYEKYGIDATGARGLTIDASGQIEFDADDASKLVESLELLHTEREEAEEPQLEQSDNSLVRLINTMIADAAAQGVSDVHIETQPGREKVRIRFRRDGHLKPYLELPHTYRAALVARIKIMCDLDISERRKPQDGKINFGKFVPGHRLELRVATIPTNNGLEDVVMRLLASAKPLPMDKLGLSPDNLERLRHAIERPYGMVLCVGPTGSGKTTTLHSALGAINTPDRKIWTAEDPVEITQTGLRQVQVNPKIDWTFAKALRSFLRADPDVIMVGEIRDQETAQTAIEASLTGHLVLSTLHTNSAPETVTRLLDMGMDPFNFGDSLLAVLAQRLVRRLCPHCRTSHEARPEQVDELIDDYLHVFGDLESRPTREALQAEWRQRFGRHGALMLHRSPGCAECDHTGFKGRAGLHELLVVSRELRRLIQTGGRVEQLQATAMADGMRTLRQDGIEKVLQGITSIEEVRATSNA